MEKIDFETHFYTKEYVNLLSKRRAIPRYVHDKRLNIKYLHYYRNVREPHPPPILDRLLDFDRTRLQTMDKAGINKQVLSLSTPGCEQFDTKTATTIAKSANDQLAKLVEKYPERFVGLASLAPQDPGTAADELKRAVQELGLRGWKTHSNIRGTYLSDKKYWPILEQAEKLDVPIFLHPTIPRIKEFAQNIGYPLAGPAFGFIVETALCSLRLILTGVFDKYPRLKFFLGHLGESLPFILNRIDFPVFMPWVKENMDIKLWKRPSEYFLSNFYIGTSGDFQKPVLECVLKVMGVNRVVFASDYPYEKPEDAVNRIESLQLQDSEKIKIYSQNAKTLLGISD
ncbi:MAG: amidohydrolase family protein [Candidatus Caldarchaeum sp.]|nr:amidohydrolase family protein [Candidatus Caldarchaeum sp.]